MQHDQGHACGQNDKKPRLIVESRMPKINNEKKTVVHETSSGFSPSLPAQKLQWVDETPAKLVHPFLYSPWLLPSFH